MPFWIFSFSYEWQPFGDCMAQNAGHKRPKQEQIAPYFGNFAWYLNFSLYGLTTICKIHYIWEASLTNLLIRGGLARGKKMANSPTLIADRITAAMGSMTTSEKRAARMLLARYPAIGLESVTAFAEQAEVSAPTVLRFITKLGFGGYPDFRRALRDEIDESRKFPLTRPRSENLDAGSDFGNELLEVVRATLAELDTSLVEQVIDLFSDERRTVNILGGDLTTTVAGHLLYHLRKMRRSVFELPVMVQERSDRLIDLGKKDILVLFDVRRYQEDVVTTARIAAQRGCTIVLFTDQWMSEAAEVATHVFRAKIETSSPWDSLLGLTTIVETIARELDSRLWSVVRPRLEAVERYKLNLLGQKEADLSSERDR